MDLALNNLQWLICHKTKPNRNSGHFFYESEYLALLKHKKEDLCYPDCKKKKNMEINSRNRSLMVPHNLLESIDNYVIF